MPKKLDLYVYFSQKWLHKEKTLNYSFKFQPDVWNRCHDLLMMSVKLSNTASLNIRGCDYWCVFGLIS